jgi:NitT/TauT family transport system permease protein
MGLWNRSRGVVLGIVGIGLLAGFWELYKAVGPVAGWKIDQTIWLPRANDAIMPHVWEMISKFGDPVVSKGGETIGHLVLFGTLYTLKLAGCGWLIGVLIGFGLALLMSRSRIAESALLPWVIASQTIPVIAIGPLLAAWGQYIKVGDWHWDLPQSAIVISAFLAFFPMAVGALRGLTSIETSQLELMHVYGVGWWRTLLRLRLPAAVPFLIPALRLSATSAVIGEVVGEVSLNLTSGVGRQIFDLNKNAGLSDPARSYPPIFGSMAVGLVAAGVVALISLALRRYRRGESS